MSAKAKPNAVRAARDRATQALKVEKATRLEYQRRNRRGERDPQRRDWWKLHQLHMIASDDKGRRLYSRLRNQVADAIDKRHGISGPRKAWWAACEDLRRAVRDLFRRPARTLDEIQIKARFWQDLCQRPDAENIEIEYLIDDAMLWFNDAVVRDLGRMGRR